MSRPAGQPPTSFVRRLLDLVAEACEPAAEGWRDLLAERLQHDLSRRFTDGHRLTPDDLNALLWRVEALEAWGAALERRLTPPPPPGPDEVEESNAAAPAPVARARAQRRQEPPTSDYEETHR